MVKMIQTIVENVSIETGDIKSFFLRQASQKTLPPFSAGSHVDVYLPDQQIRQYSLCGDPADRTKYVLGVLKNLKGKGGSILMHEDIYVDSELTISFPKNNFTLVDHAQNSILLAAGIGITPMLAMCHHLNAANQKFTLHYCTHSRNRTAFLNILENSDFKNNVIIHHDEGDFNKGLDIENLLSEYNIGTHIYCCGPVGFMNAVKKHSEHWLRENIHFEHFENSNIDLKTTSMPFEIEIASSGKRYNVPSDKSILQVLNDVGYSVDYSCGEGVCGTCITGVLDGVPDHRDQILNEQEKEEGNIMTVCCSRAKSPILTLDL